MARIRFDRSNWACLTAGLGLIGLGGLGFFAMFSGGAGGPGPFAWLGLFSPALIVHGAVVACLAFTAEPRVVSSGSLLATGAILLAVGACPWAWTHWVLGGRPGNEGAGMLGTLLFITAGLPGLCLTLFSLIAVFMRR